MTDTAADLITQALKMSGVLGIGQVAQAADTSDALFQVNLILGQWNRKRWLNLDLIDVFIVTTGAQSYSVGTGGDISTPRPDRLEAVFLRLLQFTPLLDGSGNELIDSGGAVITDGGSYNGVDHPLYLIQGREEYNRITLKGMPGWPRAAFYDSAYPLGNLFISPIPAAGLFEIHCSLKTGIAQITDPTQPLLLPDEYSDALLWTLAARLRPMYQMPPDPTITAAMRAALNTIRVANTQIPAAQMPAGLSRRTRGRGADMAGFIGGWTT